MNSTTLDVATSNAELAVAQHSHGLATQSLWLLAWASQVGSRHLAHGKPCEDSLAHRFYANNRLAMACADGISGGAAGDVASAAAVQYCTGFAPLQVPTDLQPTPSATTPALAQTTLWGELQTAPPPSPAAISPLQTHLNGLDEHVQQAVAQQATRAGATTLAAVWLLADGTGWLTHLGDVRAYRYTPAPGQPPGLEPLTHDHTYTNACEAPPHFVPAGNPNRMAGNGFGGNPPMQPLALLPGQWVLLCSDGLHGFLSDEQLANELSPLHHAAAHAPARLPLVAHAVARRLLRKAVAAGGDDDIAVQLLCFSENRR